MSTPNMNAGLLEHFGRIEENHRGWVGRRHLNIGCLTGETLSHLHGYYPQADLYGVDTSDVAVRYSKKRGHKKIFNASALKLPFRSNCFSIILFLDVLKHINHDEKALLEAKKDLKTGGKI